MGEREQRSRTTATPREETPEQPEQTARIGFIKSADAQLKALSKKERDGLLQKLKELAFNPALGKPLVGQLKGCVRVTYGRIRCVARCAEGVAVVLVLVVAKRAQDSRVDVYELASQVVTDGGDEIKNALKAHIAAYLAELTPDVLAKLKGSK